MLYNFTFVPNLGCLVLVGTQRFPDAPEADANISNSGRQLPMYHYAHWSYGHGPNSCRWLPMYHYDMAIPQQLKAAANVAMVKFNFDVHEQAVDYRNTACSSVI